MPDSDAGLPDAGSRNIDVVKRKIIFETTFKKVHN